MRRALPAAGKACYQQGEALQGRHRWIGSAQDQQLENLNQQIATICCTLPKTCPGSLHIFEGAPVCDLGPLPREKAAEEGDKLLVFTQSKISLDVIEAFFESELKWKRGSHYLRMDGDTKMKTQKSDVAFFNSDTNCIVYLITSQTGGQGLNITSANRVIIYDISWNPTVDEQAIFRAYRLGQQKEVFIYRLYAKGKSAS